MLGGSAIAVPLEAAETPVVSRTVEPRTVSARRNAKAMTFPFCRVPDRGTVTLRGLPALPKRVANSPIGDDYNRLAAYRTYISPEKLPLNEQQILGVPVNRPPPQRPLAPNPVDDRMDRHGAAVLKSPPTKGRCPPPETPTGDAHCDTNRIRTHLHPPRTAAQSKFVVAVGLAVDRLEHPEPEQYATGVIAHQRHRTRFPGRGDPQRFGRVSGQPPHRGGLRRSARDIAHGDGAQHLTAHHPHDHGGEIRVVADDDHPLVVEQNIVDVLLARAGRDPHDVRRAGWV